MQQLFPECIDIGDPVAAYTSDSRPAPTDRPWVMLNMISSVDGAVSIDGRSGGLGGPADKAVFTAIRAVPDVILVGAGTVVAERYNPPRSPEDVAALRVARGQAAAPRLAIVTASLRIDLGHAAFSDPANRPIVITADDAHPGRKAALATVADIVESGPTGALDLARALAELRRRDAKTVLCEGGPTLNGSVLDAGVLDEVCLSFSPALVGGDSPRIFNGASAERRALALDRILEADGMLFYRYLSRPNPT
ncbi:MAG: pyrimidine reductase family protein [Actinobacteria bacterium]|nr:pyrimidine reductase family protein [Actinomycetota bacterium]